MSIAATDLTCSSAKREFLHGRSSAIHAGGPHQKLPQRPCDPTLTTSPLTLYWPSPWLLYRLRLLWLLQSNLNDVSFCHADRASYVSTNVFAASCNTLREYIVFLAGSSGSRMVLLAGSRGSLCGQVFVICRGLTKQPQIIQGSECAIKNNCE